eukprot:COSAG02_NODE_1096_length_14601_cov_185.142946_9_plen_49_part_00
MRKQQPPQTGDTEPDISVILTWGEFRKCFRVEIDSYSCDLAMMFGRDT